MGRLAVEVGAGAFGWVAAPRGYRERMASDDQPLADDADTGVESTDPGHPAQGNSPVSAGEALSGVGPRPDGALGARIDVSDDEDEAGRAPATDDDSRTRAVRGEPGPDRPPTGDAPDGEEVADEFIDYFSGEVAEESPASDTDAPPPG